MSEDATLKDMDISVEVRFKYLPPELDLNGYSFSAEVINAIGMSDKIFVYHCGIPANDEDSKHFSHVASMADLEEFPEDAPDIDNEMPYYRVPSVSLVFRDSKTMFETKELLENDINSLVYALRVNKELIIQEEVTFDGSETTVDIPWNSTEMLI